MGTSNHLNSVKICNLHPKLPEINVKYFETFIAALLLMPQMNGVISCISWHDPCSLFYRKPHDKCYFVLTVMFPLIDLSISGVGTWC